MLMDSLQGNGPRQVVGLLLATSTIFGWHAQTARAAEERAGFSFATARELARSLAAKDFQPEQNADLPEALKKLTYDQYQAVRFRPEHNLWKDDHLRFMAQFFQRGYLY